jgi:hypothetical protein
VEGGIYNNKSVTFWPGQRLELFKMPLPHVVEALLTEYNLQFENVIQVPDSLAAWESPFESIKVELVGASILIQSTKSVDADTLECI